MSAAKQIATVLITFKRVIYDLYPLLLLIPLSLMAIAIVCFPEAEKAPSAFSIEAILDAVLLVISFVEALAISRYDRWVLRPVIASSIRLKELILHWIVEPFIAISISLLGLIVVFLMRSWAPIIPYVSLSYTAFLIIGLRLKSHFSIIDQRLERLGGIIVSR